MNRLTPTPWASPTATPDFTLTFDQPQDWPSANDRMHHMQRARLVKYWRDLAHAKTRQAAPTPLERAHIVVTFHKPTKRIYDPANLYVTAKSVVDGMVGDAGLLPGDDYRFLVGPDMRYGEPGPRRFVVDVFGLEAS